MSIEVDGKTIATTDSGFLENPDDWTESVAKAMAKSGTKRAALGHHSVLAR